MVVGTSFYAELDLESPSVICVVYVPVLLCALL
jgi:hypothetical protein